ncbi:hypothetical protein JXQ70_07190 [bacterium]|nr:hypothetical protein [bacterium]
MKEKGKIKKDAKYMHILKGFIVFFISGILTVLSFVIGFQVFSTALPLTIGWRSSATSSELNELGFRGQPINYNSDDYVVVLLGDSYVESITGCTFNAIPERRLEYHYSDRAKRWGNVFASAESFFYQDFNDYY